MRATHLPAVPIVTALLLAGCSGDRAASTPAPPTPPSATASAPPSGAPSAAGGTAAHPTTATATATATAAGPPTRQQLRDVRVQARRLADFDHPTAVADRGGDLYVTERTGRVLVLRGGRGTPRQVLDLRGQVRTEGERGLLGLAFSPDGERLYLSFIDRGGDNRLVEHRVSSDRVERRARDVLRVDQPGETHVGGQIAFGPEGMLWWGVGEGGATHTTSGGHAGSTPPRGLDNLLGKILRIDPEPSGGRSYTVPPDNPYVDRAGARPEIWAYGMRNPWRWSFDPVDRELWISDVGHYEVEEVDRLRLDRDAGAHLGWPYFEGDRRWQRGTPPQPYVRPLLTYGHDDGRCAVIGGYVYRGSRIQGLQGAYLFSDFCDGTVRALVERDGEVAHQTELDAAVKRVVSFGQDSAGELYFLSSKGSLFRLEPRA